MLPGLPEGAIHERWKLVRIVLLGSGDEPAVGLDFAGVFGDQVFEYLAAEGHAIGEFQVVEGFPRKLVIQDPANLNERSVNRHCLRREDGQQQDGEDAHSDLLVLQCTSRVSYRALTRAIGYASGRD